MAHFEDLSPCPYFSGFHVDILRAIGWLEAGHEYVRGDVSREFFEKLCELLQRPWTPYVFCGYHGCGFCRFTHGIASTRFHRDGNTIRIPGLSCLNLFVPGDGVVYVSPELIAHYVDSHGYKPPEEYVQAVLECPCMWSAEYFDALQACGWDVPQKERQHPDERICPACGSSVAPGDSSCPDCDLGLGPENLDDSDLELALEDLLSARRQNRPKPR